MKATKHIHNGEPVWKMYDVVLNGRKFEIDGQNGDDNGTNEWQVFYVINDENEWCDTYATKREALQDIPNIVSCIEANL